MNYDVMHDRWIVTWLEIDPSQTFDYLDIAVSQSNSPTQPTPGAQYNIYQIGTNFEPNGGTPSFCDYDTMGADYWSLDVTCVNFRGSFVGNTQIVFQKIPMLSGGTSTFYWLNDSLKISGGSANAFRLSPSIEEGVQDAEFFTSTDAGYGGPSSNMGICAWTNLNNLPAAPTVTCQNVNLGASYTDPLAVRQSGGPNNIDPGLGVKQVYYKAGRLYLAQTTAIGGVHDGIYWAEVQPQLTTKAALIRSGSTARSSRRQASRSTPTPLTPGCPHSWARMRTTSRSSTTTPLRPASQASSSPDARRLTRRGHGPVRGFVLRSRRHAQQHLVAGVTTRPAR